MVALVEYIPQTECSTVNIQSKKGRTLESSETVAIQRKEKDQKEAAERQEEVDAQLRYRHYFPIEKSYLQHSSMPLNFNPAYHHNLASQYYLVDHNEDGTIFNYLISGLVNSARFIDLLPLGNESAKDIKNAIWHNLNSPSWEVLDVQINRPILPHLLVTLDGPKQERKEPADAGRIPCAMVATNESFSKILDLIDNPPPPSRALKKLFGIEED